MTRLPRLQIAAALVPVALVAALAGCARPPAMPPVAPVPVVTPVPVIPVAGVSGLEERKPDACKAGNYRSSIGQPGSVIPGLGVTREYRVVEFRGIEPQEYDPLRIVFRLDQSGIIQNVDCG